MCQRIGLQQMKTSTRILALVPSHNEEERLPNAIRSLFTQTTPIDHIIVVSDNSTDRTPQIARSWGRRVELFETVGNRNRKAGALNQAIASLDEPDGTWILVMDADSAITPNFVEMAMIAAEDPEVGAVGGIFTGDGHNGLLGAVQSLEYTRYAREIGRDQARAKVLTGTATMLQMGVLRQVMVARQTGRLPGSGVYNLAALTEDFELTLAIKSLGYKTVSPRECVVVTETMGSLRQLWAQRVRWQRGAIQTLGAYGISKVTRSYIFRQIETGIGLAALLALWMVTFLTLWQGSFAVHPTWMLIGGAFYIERVVSSWRAGRMGRAIAATMVIDVAFDLFIGAVYIYCLVHSMTKQRLVWGDRTIDLVVEGTA
jgi:cellulose synthase/poly-beta-1,6-N-acetylglucosamine synthase-like glycosyltransferase